MRLTTIIPLCILRMTELTTLKFKIIDSDSIKLFENILHWSANTEFRTLNEAKTYHFVKIDENPRIDPAIYKQKWLWEHEEDWQRWMDAHRGNSKQ